MVKTGSLEERCGVRCVSSTSDPEMIPDSSHDMPISNLGLRSEAIAIASEIGSRSAAAMTSTKIANARIGAGCRIGKGDNELQVVVSANLQSCYVKWRG